MPTQQAVFLPAILLVVVILVSVVIWALIETVAHRAVVRHEVRKIAQFIKETQ